MSERQICGARLHLIPAAGQFETFECHLTAGHGSDHHIPSGGGPAWRETVDPPRPEANR